MDDVVVPRLAAALSHPSRVRVLRILDARGQASTRELADEVDVSLGTMGYHVRRLKALGFLEVAESVPRRGMFEHYYRLSQPGTAPPLKNGNHRPDPARAAIHLELSQVVESAWAAVTAGGFESPNAQLVRCTVQLDALGREQLEHELAGWRARVAEIADRARADKGQACTRACLVLMIVPDVEP
jgi:DNA-binding transcriptional ArsR family regulator